jgi:hypothetical protein
MDLYKDGVIAVYKFHFWQNYQVARRRMSIKIYIRRLISNVTTSSRHSMERIYS